ncbi:MAG: PAS domain S-box protein [Bacteroidetes bacterium]|nr:PAS domain S-box protein [Bacteroidota bacterium]
MENTRFYKLLTGGFIVVLSLAGLLTWYSCRTLTVMENAQEWVRHTFIVIKQANEANASLLNAESSRLQLTISNTPLRRRIFDDDTKQLAAQIRDLKQITSDNPLQQRRIDSLAKYADLAIGDMNTAGITDHYKEATTGWLKRIISSEELLLASREAQSERSGLIARIVISGSAAVCFAFLAIFFGLIWRTFKAKRVALEQLASSEGKFHSAFEYSGTGMAIVSAEGKWMNINSRVSEMLGYSKQQLLNMTFQDITHPDDLNADLALLKRLHSGEINMYQMEKRYIHQDGYFVWAMLTVSLIRHADGAPDFHIAQIADITEYKNLLEELQLKNEALSTTSDQLNKEVQQLHDFNGIVAHNLRGPSAAIVNIVELLKAETTEAGKKELLDLVDSSARALNSTLKDLMELLEIRLNRNIVKDPCEIKDVMWRTTQLLQAEIVKSNAEIMVNFEAPRVNFPKAYLESVFYNLISNSLKYQSKTRKPVIRIHSRAEADKIRITFEDNGIGIDMEKNGKDMFKFSKVFHKGYDSKGVGLYITKNQVEACGGTITVESQPDAGTQFTITLPYSEPSSASSQVKTPALV